MKLPTQIRFANKKIEEEMMRLQKGTFDERELFFHLQKALARLKENSFCGIQIQKSLIPKKYGLEQSIPNLWKYNLPKGWRLLYSIQTEEILIICLILEWLPHKEYEKRFKY